MTGESAKTLRQTVSAAVERLRALSDADASVKPSPARWSKKEILGHLIDSASNNHQRFVRAILQGELRFPAYDQEGWARCQDYQAADWRLLIDLWQAYNEHLAHVIAHIPADRLATPCRIGDGESVTLGWLVEDYQRHLDHHVAQLDRP
jgi:hypothetical protein